MVALDDSNRIVNKRVDVGPSFKDFRVINSGITPSDRIVLEGIQMVRPGMPVKPVVTEYESRYSDKLNK